MDQATRIRRAREDLERHRDTMIKLWGAGYQAHPEYHRVVQEVAAARTPWYALCDRIEPKAP